MDVTPIKLFGGIPDEDLRDQATESMMSLLKTPQAMSTPITEGIESGRILPQGRISTLSSVVRPMPMTATRTIAITREES